jgi:hypothetical protein
MVEAQLLQFVQHDLASHVLDRSDGTGDSQAKSGGKLVLTCPREGCRHQANYTAAVISRYQKQDADLDPKPSKGKP